ncbi:MAG: glycosyltransferase [Acidobacteria bacterium]|nr:glycosyltransferase [Acidobacteriota bacterium]
MIDHKTNVGFCSMGDMGSKENFEISDPLVTICVPTYNDGRFLKASLDSIRKQTYADLEIIISDDASDDDTESIVGSLNDPRISYHRHSSNVGGFENMNRCIALARGDFVAIYHSDDIYERTIVEKELRFLQAYPEAGAVFCLDRYIDDAGHVFGEMTLPRQLVGKTLYGLREIVPALLANKNCVFCCPTFMTRREVFAKVGLFDQQQFDIAADLDMWLRILRHCRVGILNEPLMKYRAGRTRWSTNYNYLRTDRDYFFFVMDHHLRSGLTAMNLPRGVVQDYEFHRYDDDIFRALNCVLRGETTAAEKLLDAPIPWEKIGWRLSKRRFRLFILRLLLRVAVKAGIAGRLLPAFYWIEYRRRIVP